MRFLARYDGEVSEPLAVLPVLLCFFRFLRVLYVGIAFKISSISLNVFLGELDYNHFFKSVVSLHPLCLDFHSFCFRL